METKTSAGIHRPKLLPALTHLKQLVFRHYYTMTPELFQVKNVTE